MNIAILINSLVFGGAERFAQRIGDYYAERGENVFYFLGDYGLKKDYAVKGRIIYTGITPLHYMNDSKLFTSVEFVSFVRKMKSLKRKYKIDVSISIMEDFNYINIFSRCSDRVIVRVATVLSKRSEFTSLYFKPKYLHFAYNRADYVVVMSVDGFNEMSNVYGIAKEKLRLIPNVAPQICLEEKILRAKNIIHVARFDPVKQQDRLIRAFSYVAKRDRESKLLFLGNGLLEDYLRNLCEIYGLSERIVFLGFSKEPEKMMCSATAFVMSSKAEGFPNAMVEAMALGLPIISTDTPGGIRDVLGKCEKEEVGFAIHQYGIMTPALPKRKLLPHEPLTDEEKKLGAAMLEILHNDALRERLRLRSLERAKYYRAENIMALWDSIVY